MLDRVHTQHSSIAGGMYFFEPCSCQTRNEVMIREGIQAVVEGRHLTEAEAMAVMKEIMEGSASPAQIAALLVGLRMKGETVEEITGCARVMRDKATFIHTPPGTIPVDTAGTGGDGAHTFNISTTAAFIAAGAGVVIAKHGNRAISALRHRTTPKAIHS